VQTSIRNTTKRAQTLEEVEAVAAVTVVNLSKPSKLGKAAMKTNTLIILDKKRKSKIIKQRRMWALEAKKNPSTRFILTILNMQVEISEPADDQSLSSDPLKYLYIAIRANESTF